MKRKVIVLLMNFVLATLFLMAVHHYAAEHQQWHTTNNIHAFEETSEALQGMLTNYMAGEQQICNSWGRYINNEGLSMRQAIDFLHKSERQDIMAHIIYMDDGSYNGLSTIAPDNNPDNNTVSYAHLNVLQNLDLNDFSENEVNSLKVYVNPINDERSFGLYYPLTLVEDGTERKALLIRLILVKEVEERWEYMSRRYANTEVAMVDLDGNYVIKGDTFISDNFLKAVDENNPTMAEEIKKAFSTDRISSLKVFNPWKQECLVTFTPMQYRDDRTLITYIPYESLDNGTYTSTTIMYITLGVGLLLLFNIYELFVFDRIAREAKASEKKAINDRKGFLATMSNGIRNPLNVITGLSAVARSQIENKELVNDSLKEISLSTDYLTAMISSLQDANDIERGKIILNPVTFNIVECAENLSNLSQFYVKEKNIDFRFYISRIEHEILIGDHVRLNEIFTNILQNALQYCDSGSKVIVDLKEEVGSDPNHVKLTYSVKDTGIGMDKETLNHIYEPFVRGKRADEYSADGIGVGLFITKKLVELMNGQISCVSRPDKGSEFKVMLELPVARENVEAMTIPSKHVLLADNDKRLCQTGQETLYSLGIVADTANSSKEALDMIKSEHEEGEDYDVLIIDYNLKELDGIETAKKIREEMGEYTPKILLSAYEYSDLLLNLQEGSVDDIISKPLFRFTLYWKISELFGIETKGINEEDYFNGMHILVVEDSDINYEVIAMILKMHGVSCEHVRNGKEALERLTRCKPMEISLVFMDIFMPYMNGIETTKAIRKLPGPISCIPIVAMSAQSSSETVDEAMAAGMDGYIFKPVEKEYLLRELRRLREKMISSRTSYGNHHVSFEKKMR